ncbi:MAG: hypothetical protein K9H16_09000 [Bacteroidales bacterium]|nr:hypothetical protein [Bacteroidales bacterium]
MMTREAYKSVLIKYIPEASFELVYQLIIKHRVFLAITRERKTKHGDFRPAMHGKPARISVNHNLNEYAFLITFLHELAHQITWEKYKKKVKPHGLEWKYEFANQLQPFIQNGIFPKEIAEKLDKDPAELYYSTVADTSLERELKNYSKANGFVLLENLPDNAMFMLPNGIKYRKLHKRRKNFLCINVQNKRQYIFNPLAEVIKLDND